MLGILKSVRIRSTVRCHLSTLCHLKSKHTHLENAGVDGDGADIVKNQMLVHQVKMALLSDLGILLALCTHLQSSYSCYYQRVELALMSISG